MKHLFLLTILCLSLLFSNAQDKKYVVFEITETDIVQNFARIHQVAPDSIKKWNNLSSDTLRPKMKVGVYNYKNLSQEKIALNSINYKLAIISKASKDVESKYNTEFQKLEDQKSAITNETSNAMQKYIDISKTKHDLKSERDEKLANYKKIKDELESMKQVLLSKSNTKNEETGKQKTIKVEKNSKKLPSKTKEKKRNDSKKDKDETNLEPKNVENKIKKPLNNGGYDLSYLEFDTKTDTLSKKTKKLQAKLAKEIDENDFSTDKNMKQVVVGEVEIKNKKKKYKLGDEVNVVRKDKAKFYLSRAMMEIDNYDLKKANSFIEKSLNLNPSYTEAYMLKGDIFAKVGLYSKAINEYERASILNASIPQLYYNMGNCYLYLGKEAKAVDMMTLAIDVDSTYVLAYSGRSSLYIDKEEYDNALKDYNSLLEINSYFYPALKGRGICFYKLGEYDKAIRDFNKLLEFEDNDASIYYHRAFAKLYKSEIYGSCMDFLKSSQRGYAEADKAIKKYCD